MPTVSFCGSVLTSHLKIKDGTDIGTVTVGNDAFYLYLTYNLTGNWYIGNAHSYAGRESAIPQKSRWKSGLWAISWQATIKFLCSEANVHFPGPFIFYFLDNNALCSTNEQYFIAMRASVRQFSNATDCTAGTDQAAWGAPFLINPGNSNEWATALYYCKQDCSIPTISWCGYSQGYWFSNPNLSWCQNVKFGNLESKQAGWSCTLASTKQNWVKKSLLPGTAIQLSLNCINSGNPIPTSIANDYRQL